MPTVAGLNFEHIFDGDKRDTDRSRKIFFGLGIAPMKFKKVSATEAELYQAPTPTFKSRELDHVLVVGPDHIDMRFRFVS